ncbi:MAG TPA: hypothetical protein VFX70_10185, partial [Mycobacteriales bacterium]|nr:hypothetical protein [Mycobacteriales bacterium]
GRRTGGAVVTLPPQYVAEHLELGYATTAHRAQGRTVDTAHALVSAASTREVLYVAATRGRQANRVYVDTAFDPDVDTAHGTTPARDPVEVLRGVLATPSADTAASQALEQAWQQRHGIATVWAEYTTIAAEACRGRYDTLLASCGLQPHELAAVQTSPAYGALLGALREADGAGLNLATAFPRLVQGRPLNSADDVAAVLHGRLQRWTVAAGGHDPGAQRIAGLFPAAPPTTDPDTQQALDERAVLIHDRARHLAALAAQRQDAWVRQLGGPPADPERRQAWYRQLVTVAAYRDRWHITSDRQPFGGPPTNEEQAADLHRAQRAAHAAIDIHRQAAWKATQERHPVPHTPGHSRGFGPTL